MGLSKTCLSEDTLVSSSHSGHRHRSNHGKLSSAAPKNVNKCMSLTKWTHDSIRSRVCTPHWTVNRSVFNAIGCSDAHQAATWTVSSNSCRRMSTIGIFKSCEAQPALKQIEMLLFTSRMLPSRPSQGERTHCWKIAKPKSGFTPLFHVRQLAIASDSSTIQIAYAQNTLSAQCAESGCFLVTEENLRPNMLS